MIIPEEGDSNRSPRRQSWLDGLDGPTRELVRRDADAFLHQSVSTPCLSAVRKAEGIWIEDTQGRRLMDFHGNSVHHVGYGHPRVIAAIQRHLAELQYAPRRYTCEPAVALAEKLGAIAPGDLKKVLFAPGGSAAIEMALMYARAATGRFKTISFWDAFHGAGFWERSVGGESLFRSGPVGPLLPGAEHVPSFGDYRNAWGVREGSGKLCVNEIRYVLEKEVDVAAVIAEPTRAVPVFPPAGFWREVRRLCNEHGALLIFDEIPTGLGKTGRMFACEHEEVVPDILVLGKSLGGGTLPIAAIVCRPELDVCAEYAHGHYTHEKNPVTCRAALETIRIIEEDGLVEHSAAMGAVGLSRLRDMMARHSLIGDVRGRGCLMGVELVKDHATREPAVAAADAVLYRALDRGLSFKTSMGNVLTISPPLIVTEDQMHQAMDVLDCSIGDVEREFGVT